jgi:(E)-4-hydroxy-3-methylbut-2-enyl-diphosphate synthase
LFSFDFQLKTEMDHKYCNNLVTFSRFITKEVKVGEVPLGASNPIRIQSMTNTLTTDTKATVEQCIRIINAGADYVRITVPGMREAENLKNIKAELRKRGHNTPLIADVHFNPKVAEKAAQWVEKVRINPGNYSEKNVIKTDYNEKDYKRDLEATYIKLLALLKICREYGTAIRVGVNHGSLSNRIMSRYGDTPVGMVESAMEFVRICAAENFNNLVVSLKSSNTRVMVQANRLLVNTMIREGLNYPLHLGVTEAGLGEDGRVKSAVGIGSLLADGLGDTIRISLTEDPEKEIPVAQALVSYFENRKNHPEIHEIDAGFLNPFEYVKRKSNPISDIGNKNLPVVFADWDETDPQSEISAASPDYYYLKANSQYTSLPDKNFYVLNMHDWLKYMKSKDNVYPLFTDSEFLIYVPKHSTLNFVIISNEDLNEEMCAALKKTKNVVLILETLNPNGAADQRSFFYQLLERNIEVPVIINRNYLEDDPEILQLKSSSDIGILLLDGFGDGIWIRNAGKVKTDKIISTSFNILQACRARTSKTEYISCPSCGRTLFDIQRTAEDIKARTSHLTHLKIAIMGCIVNGPGEMADADYGFVGAGIGRISLYKGKTLTKRNIPSENAVEELIHLIKENNDWKEPDEKRISNNKS